jgi:hypothetical protein
MIMSNIVHFVHYVQFKEMKLIHFALQMNLDFHQSYVNHTMSKFDNLMHSLISWIDV